MVGVVFENFVVDVLVKCIDYYFFCDDGNLMIWSEECCGSVDCWSYMEFVVEVSFFVRLCEFFVWE